MPDISIEISGKIARTSGQPVIVCGNSDYNIQFSFDSEWDDYAVKTARFVYCTGGTIFHQDIVFSGNACNVPVLYDTDCVAVGVYAGDIHTSTPARIPCARCITDGASVHPEPAPDVYEQILTYLAELDAAGIIIGFPVLIADGTDLSEVGTAALDADTIDLLQTEPYASNIENGSFGDNDGQPTSRSDRVRCNSYIDIPADAEMFTVFASVGAENCKFFADMYDSSGQYLYSVTSSSDPLTNTAYFSFVECGRFRAVPAAAGKLRVGLRNQAGTNFSPSSLTAFQVVFYKI